MPESKHYSATIRWRRRGLILVPVEVIELCPVCGADPDGRCINRKGKPMPNRHAVIAPSKPSMRPCAVCGQEFEVTNEPGVRNLCYCSDDCRRIGRARTQRAYVARQRHVVGRVGSKCQDCGTPVSDSRYTRCAPCANRARWARRKAS